MSGDIGDIARELSIRVSRDVDAGILEEIISLFNSGVLKLYCTDKRHSFDVSRSNLTVSQCVKVQFEGKQEIERLTRERDELKANLERAEKTIIEYATIADSALSDLYFQTKQAEKKDE